MSNKEGKNISQRLKQWVKEVKALEIEDPVFSRIIAKFEHGNFDEQLFLILCKHLKTIEKYYLRQLERGGNISDHFTSEDDKLQYLISYFFLENIGSFSDSELVFDSNYVDPVKSVPIEAFFKPNRVSAQNFEENLKVKDVLFAEVVKTDLKDLYEEFLVLRVICKVDDDSIVYHLDIKVHLFKKQEESLLGRPFQLNEILQVVVIGSIRRNNVMKYYASADTKFLNKSSADHDCMSQRKPPIDLSLFKAAGKFSCYAHYLDDATTHFNQQHNLIEGIRSLGLDPYRSYSFNGEEHTHPKGFRVGAFKKAAYLAQQMESNKCLEEGNVSVLNGDISNALTAFDKALKIWPENYTVFASRGQMYADFKKNKEYFDLKKACQDFGLALKINPHSESVKNELSEIYLHIAKKLITKKKYVEAKKVLQKCVTLSRSNEKAIVLRQKINKKLLSTNANQMTLN